MKKIFTSILLSILFYATSEARDIKGSVKDTDGKPLVGVTVSDGYTTTLTDKRGKFRLDTYEESCFVFISTPSGYHSSVSPGELSYFKELDEKTKTYDFLVKKRDLDDTNHNIIVIADPQISDASEFPDLEKQAKDIGEHVKGLEENYTFGLCLGDIVGWNHALYPQYNETMSHSGIDFRHIMGNHDMTNYGPVHETSFVQYQKAFGPAWYSFNVGKIHYVVLNDNFFIGRDWYYIGYIDKKQMEWLKKDLSYVPEGSKVIVSLHIPTTLSEKDRKQFSYNEIAEILTNKKALYEVLKPYDCIIFSGHTHTSTNQIISENLMEQNIPGFCGAWWCGPVCIDGSPIGYKVVNVRGNDIEWQFKSCGETLDHQMKLYVDDIQLPGYIMAHVWDYDPEWKVEYYEDGVKICDMEQCQAYDPVAREHYKGPSKHKHSWVYAAQTENMFRAKYSEGAKELEVVVTDRFGRRFSQKITR